MNDVRSRLRGQVERDAERLRRHARERRSILIATRYLTALGLGIALPIVAGAYAGLWLDQHTHGFSFSWTVTLIILGVAVGVVDAWLLLRE